MRYEILISLNRGSSYAEGPPSVSQPEAVATVARLLRAASIPAATIVPTFGVWEGAIEPSLAVVIYAADDAIGQGTEAVAQFALDVGREFRQDCVAIGLDGRLHLAGSRDSILETERAIAALDVRSEAR